MQWRTQLEQRMSALESLEHQQRSGLRVDKALLESWHSELRGYCAALIDAEIISTEGIGHLWRLVNEAADRRRQERRTG